MRRKGKMNQMLSMLTDQTFSERGIFKTNIIKKMIDSHVNAKNNTKGYLTFSNLKYGIDYLLIKLDHILLHVLKKFFFKVASALILIFFCSWLFDANKSIFARSKVFRFLKVHE